MRLGRIGFDQVVGYLQSGMMALAKRSDLIAGVQRMTAKYLEEWLATGANLWVLDVRTAVEREEIHIPTSVHIPLNRLTQRYGEIQTDRPVVAYCAGGYRSSIAASLLMQRIRFSRRHKLLGSHSSAVGRLIFYPCCHGPWIAKVTPGFWILT